MRSSTSAPRGLTGGALRPDVDVWLWLDIGVLKQGTWRNNPVTKASIKRLFDRVKATSAPMDSIPFPGITERQTVYPTGNVWRFVVRRIFGRRSTSRRLMRHIRRRYGSGSQPPDASARLANMGHG